jgi:two-component system phosphate regulon response regulator PhoB
VARILIANDEADLLALCQETLEMAGHDVDIAAGGHRALELALQHRPDLVVVDWVMTDMDGGALIAKMRAIPQTKNLPVLAISALRDGRARAELSGADNFLQKPFDPDELVDAVNQTLGLTASPIP